MNDKLKKILWVVNRKLNNHLFKLKFRFKKENNFPDLENFIGNLELKEILEKKDLIIKIADLYTKHYFDILGSGWKKLKSEKKLFYKIGNLISIDYEPIEWHIDGESGYKWESNKWYAKYVIEVDKGYDIKWPWELTRMQYLIFFCWAYYVSENQEKEKYYIEFRNQILDFIESNPPFYGINWICPMDVAIRAVNLLISYDIFKNVLKKSFDKDFDSIFKNYIYLHGYYIYHNLENPPFSRNNHYLADLCGLIFISSYLRTKETKKWLDFAYKEIIKEFAIQFNDDGSNYEGSTAYHCLSFELVLYSLGLLLNKANRDHYPIPDYLFDKLIKSANFIVNIRKFNGEIILIGDNDSGRLLKLNPDYELISFASLKERFKNIQNLDFPFGEYPYENSLKKDELLSAFSSFLSSPFFNNAFTNSDLSKSLMKELSSDFKINRNIKDNIEVNQPHYNIQSLIHQWNNIKDPYKAKYIIDLVDNWNKNLKVKFFQSFGLYIYESDYVKIFIRCGGLNNKNKSGHYHNDQLSIIVSIVERDDYILDPGTYKYTSDKKVRNLYRSVRAHFTPRCKNIDIEQEVMTDNLFEMKFKSNPKCLFFNNDIWVGEHYGFGFRTVRFIMFNKSGVEIYDMFIDTNVEMERLELKTQVPYCPAYGWVYAE